MSVVESETTNAFTTMSNESAPLPAAGLSAENLQNYSKEQLIAMCLTLSSTVQKLEDDFKRMLDLCLYHLERKVNMSQQYYRRDTLEITGIPASVKDEDIEGEVLETFKEAKVQVNRQPMKALDIQAAHRIGSKHKVIVKVVNRKFVRNALVKGKNLKNNKRYGNNTRIYLNDSFIPEFNYFNFLIRNALKNKEIYRYKVRNGVNHVQVTEDSEFVEIGHANDLKNLGIAVPDQTAADES